MLFKNWINFFVTKTHGQTRSKILSSEIQFNVHGLLRSATDSVWSVQSKAHFDSTFRFEMEAKSTVDQSTRWRLLAFPPVKPHAPVERQAEKLINHCSSVYPHAYPVLPRWTVHISGPFKAVHMTVCAAESQEILRKNPTKGNATANKKKCFNWTNILEMLPLSSIRARERNNSAPRLVSLLWLLL